MQRGALEEYVQQRKHFSNACDYEVNAFLRLTENFSISHYLNAKISWNYKNQNTLLKIRVQKLCESENYMRKYGILRITCVNAAFCELCNINCWDSFKILNYVFISCYYKNSHYFAIQKRVFQGREMKYKEMVQKFDKI